jgi:magnesium transporter
VGSQATVTIIRALAVGHIDLDDALLVLWRELRIALLLGLLLSGIAYARAVTWSDSAMTAVIVASSIFAIVLWADSVGALLPIAAAKLQIDPALISGPLMSTLVDATGLLIYFSIARLVLG